jgi:hypothetical protein
MGFVGDPTGNFRRIGIWTEVGRDSLPASFYVEDPDDRTDLAIDARGVGRIVFAAASAEVDEEGACVAHVGN